MCLFVILTAEIKTEVSMTAIYPYKMSLNITKNSRLKNSKIVLKHPQNF